MTDGWSAKCGPDTCAIGKSGSEQEGAEMAEDNQSPPEEGGKDTTLTKQEAQKVTVADMCPDKIAEVNPGVNAWKAKVGELEKEKEELVAKLKEGEDRDKELEKYKAVEAAAEAAELEKAVTFMKERIGEEVYNERYPTPEEGGDAVTYAQLEADSKFLDTQAAPEVPAEPETPAEPEPAQNADAPKPFYLVGTAGVADREGENEPDPRPDRTDGKIPL